MKIVRWITKRFKIASFIAVLRYFFCLINSTGEGLIVYDTKNKMIFSKIGTSETIAVITRGNWHTLRIPDYFTCGFGKRDCAKVLSDFLDRLFPRCPK
jgi:hypothetical protein